MGWPLQACNPGFRFAHPGYLLRGRRARIPARDQWP